MLPTRAGLAKLFLSALTMKMRVTAVLLLIITLSTMVVQAVPVPTHPTALSTVLSGSEFATSANRIRCTAAHMPMVAVHNAPQFITLTPNPIDTPVHHQHSAPTQIALPSELLERENTEALILERRFGLGSAVHHIGHAVSHAAHTVGHAAKQAGHFIAHHKAAIAKVGLKVAATVSAVAGKAAPFIPGMGSVAGKFLVQGGKKLNSASNAIHAHIGGKLGAAMRGMDTAQRIVNKVP